VVAGFGRWTILMFLQLGNFKQILYSELQWSWNTDQWLILESSLTLNRTTWPASDTSVVCMSVLTFKQSVCHCWPTWGPDMRCLSTSVRLPSVRCPSRGHTSKTKQDRPIVTMEHRWEAGITGSVATIRSCPRCTLGRYSDFI